MMFAENAGMKPVVLLALVLCFASSAVAGTMPIELNGIKIGLDERTGGIVSLSHPGPGTVLKVPPESACLVDVAYPTKSFVPLRLATRFSEARIAKGEGIVTITWDRLGPSRSDIALPEGKVSARVELKAAPNYPRR